MVNIYTRVISLPNEYGKDQFASFLMSLSKKAKNDHSNKVKFAFLLKALNLMQSVDHKKLLDISDINPFYSELEIEVEGKSHIENFELIKPLKKEDIYELRINLKSFNWRFRATFFPHASNGVQFHCFVYPFIKVKNKQDLTDFYRDKTFSIRDEVITNPLKYTPHFT